MSHASVLIALDIPQGDRIKDLLKNEKAIYALIEHEMKPFDENGQWFKDGSRWDWWTIGGRYSGRLMGKDICLRQDLDAHKLTAQAKKDRIAYWKSLQKELKDKPADYLKQLGKMAEMIYGITHETTEEEYINQEWNFGAYAFLRKRSWHESERMGWFGTKAKTECEINRKEGEERTGKCIMEKDGAKIICWQEEWEKWERKFWARFIEHLEPETLLVMVDYHV